MIGYGIQSYRKTSVVTTDPGKLVLMCYNGAIESLKIAIQKYKDKDFEGKYKAIKKTEDIIDELRCSLNFEKGGDIARNLESLYNYMTRKLILSDVNKDINGLNEVVGMLEELKSAWEIVFDKPAENKPSKMASPENRDRIQRLDRVSV